MSHSHHTCFCPSKHTHIHHNCPLLAREVHNVTALHIGEHFGMKGKIVCVHSYPDRPPALSVPEVPDNPPCNSSLIVPTRTGSLGCPTWLFWIAVTDTKYFLTITKRSLKVTKCSPARDPTAD